MCGARCLIGRGEASKGASRGIQGGEMSIGARCRVPDRGDTKATHSSIGW